MRDHLRAALDALPLGTAVQMQESLRRKGPRFATSTLAATVLVFAAAGASAQSYTFTTLGTLGGSESFGAGINNAGQVVGYSMLAGDSVGHATFWDSGAPTDLTPSYQVRISAIVDAHFRLIVDGETSLSVTRWGSAQVLV